MSGTSPQHRVLSWLVSVSDFQTAEPPYPAAARPRKRARLDEAQSDAYETHDAHNPSRVARRLGALSSLPTPSVSATGPRSARRQVMSASPSKRRRDEQDLTPRAVRTAAADEACSVASSSSYTSSSRNSGPSRSSPTKQIRHAGLQRTGFRQASFEFDPMPPLLENICRRLKGVYYGCGILPTRLRTEFAPLHLPDFFFHRDDEDAITATRRYPERIFVRHILTQANECDLDGKGEESWNMDVHSRILAWVLQEDSNDDVCLISEYCTTAGLLREYKPRGAPGKMVDFCLTIRPKRPEDLDAIDLTRSDRPGDSINHTDWGSLSKYPIAISIETKRHGEQYDAALVQLATWHSAQWRSLQWGRQEEPDALPAIEFLSGLIVQGHDWQFVPSLLGKDAVPRVVRPPLQIGDTRTEPGILKLLMSLQELKRDAEQTFWPAFKSHMLGNTVVRR